MKRTNIHIFAALALLFALAACTQDEAGFLSPPAPVPRWTAIGRVCRAWQS